ncbi:hypothetical protein J3R30DRAFT_1058546 [Lentinula aciculospora]|uniref:Uncharacterized protein n=1 Tax=Lentinula aciculospora TaxID=153920 RepID=A0A9W9DII7_9AGAR|nr:hypothetical protein J3R30DRAFT_1058546 [Lentinula aciculospora]
MAASTMFFSLRSWFFVISCVLVRCRCESATLESKDVNNLNSYEGDGLPPLKRNDLTGVTRLFRRATSSSDSTVFAILTGCVAGLLILLVLFIFVWTRLKRRLIVDVEKGVVSLDSEVPPRIPPSRLPSKSTTRLPSNRNSWAFLQLRFARRKLWATIEKESPQAHPFPFPNPNGTTDPQRHLPKDSLPFQDVPPLSKPEAAAVPDQSTIAHPRSSPTHREKNMSCAVFLPVDGGILSIPALVAESEGDDMNTPSNRRQHVAQDTVLHVSAPTGTGGTGSAVVAQTIIANKQKSRQESLSRSPTRSRKGSLLSGPPLTVHPHTLPSTEEESVDIASYYASTHTSSRELEEELNRMLSDQSMVNKIEEI